MRPTTQLLFFAGRCDDDQLPISCRRRANHLRDCKQPFPVVNGYVEAWRSSTGGYFCNEFCAEDEEEVSFQDHRSAS